MSEPNVINYRRFMLIQSSEQAGGLLGFNLEAGSMIEFSREEAELLGMFEEDALSLDEALKASFDGE